MMEFKILFPEPPEPPTAVFVGDVSSRTAEVSWYPAYDGKMETE